MAGGWQVSGTYQYQSGFPLTFTNNIYWDASCGDPSSLVSNIGEKVSGGVAGLDVPGWDTKCFYFHDAAVQTNGVDDPAKQRADPRINPDNNVRYFPSTLPDVRSDNLHLLDIGLYKNFSLPREMKLQVRFECDQRVELHGAVEPGRRSEGHERTVRHRQHGSQQPARPSDRPAPDVLGR